jgi:hypothetical protein
MTDLDELEAKARAATPGPWDNHSINGEPIESVWLADGSVVATWAIKEPRFEFHAPQARADAAFIAAANPAAVLELLERLRAAEHPGERGSVRRLMFDLDRYRAIVRDLAEHDPDTYEEWIDAINGSGRWCPLCDAAYTEGPGKDLYTPMPLEAHDAQCTHRRAVEATR